MSTCRVLTFKEGLLSAIAHDLELDVPTHEVHVEGDAKVEATFDARSIRVVTAKKNGQSDPSALSAADKKKIEATIADEVLESGKFPQIRFVSTSVAPAGDGFAVRGDLTLHGVTRSISFTTRTEGAARVAEVTLHQPDFGIAPYRAMLGTLKLKPDVRVRVELQ